MKMRLGFCSIYSWRPHVEHIAYLAKLAEGTGHYTSFLTCDADLPTCYTRQLRSTKSAAFNCSICRLGGIRSFEGRRVFAIGRMDAQNPHTTAQAFEWSRSSASTLRRLESDAEFESVDFKNLTAAIVPATRKAYSAAVNWIRKERLDAVILFNGRIDATRGVLEAARNCGVPFISVERTWFGDGLQLLPGENCLGLATTDKMTAEWCRRPLLRTQALRAAKHVASRFLKNNTREWRAYNTAAISIGWPAAGSRRILLLPGSRNEFMFHPDWHDSWPEKTAAYDDLISRLALAPDDVVLRCHPNWAENIGSVDGRASETYYCDWARRRGIAFIPSNDPASTLELIEQADAVIVGGSSAALEAGILGKQIIAVAPSVYQQAGFQERAYTPAEAAAIRLRPTTLSAETEDERKQVARLTLRFAYTMIYRIPQFVDYVQCETTTRYHYRDGANPQRLIDLARTGVLRADDERYATSNRDEDEVLELVERRDWRRIVETPLEKDRQSPIVHVKRRAAFRMIDTIRDSFPRGDLLGGRVKNLQ